jgi:uncharacterized protein (TIGR03435 family)
MRAALALLVLLAQAQASFEVVSIKPVDEKAVANFFGTGLRGNRWFGTHVSLRKMIQASREREGFDMPERVVGGPGWIDSVHFDVEASTNSRPSDEQLQAMIRGMLSERFHLRTHLEKKTLQAYELVLAQRDGKPGPRLARADADCRPRCGMTINYGPTHRMTSDGAEMTRFAFVLSTIVQRPVIDRTGLAGQFKLSLEYAPLSDAANVTAPDAPSLFTALEEQLGLRLHSIKAPLDVLVVDSADKPTFD